MTRLEQAKEEIKSRSKDVKKAIMIYTIELLVFAVVFLVLGILELLGIIGNNTGWRSVFTYVTMVGVALFIGMTIFSLSSPKRRAKMSLFDRVILMPAPIAILVLDIITLIKGVDATLELHRYLVGSVFCYFSFCYVVQAIYHYFFPIPMMYEVDEKEEAPAETSEEAAPIEEAPDTKEQVAEEKKEEEKPE